MSRIRLIPPASRHANHLRRWHLLLGAALACQLPWPAEPSAPTPPPATPPTAPSATTAPLAAIPQPAQPAPPTVPPPMPPALAPGWSFPPIERAVLRNGLEVHAVERPGAPLLELRLVVHSGSRSDGKKPGVSALATRFLKHGGAGKRDATRLVEWLDSLGAELELDTTLDSTFLTLRVRPTRLHAALRVLADLALRPRFDEAAFQALRPRYAQGVAQRLAGDARWAASTVAYRKLFGESLASAGQGASLKRTTADCKRWHRRHFSPRNATLLAAGDFTHKELLREVKSAFGPWRGRTVRAPKAPKPAPPRPGRIYLLSRRGSAHSEIQVVTLGPERGGQEWLPTEVLVHALGKGRTSRLWSDLREERALAFEASCSSARLARGPVPLVLRAATAVENTSETLAALLEHYAQLAAEGLSAEELEGAQRFLKRNLPVRAGTARGILEQATQAARAGLPVDYFSTYNLKLEEVGIDALSATAARYFSRAPVVVVAGDVERLLEPLSHLGELHVLLPEQGFALDRVQPLVAAQPSEPQPGAALPSAEETE